MTPAGDTIRSAHGTHHEGIVDVEEEHDGQRRNDNLRPHAHSRAEPPASATWPAAATWAAQKQGSWPDELRGREGEGERER